MSSADSLSALHLCFYISNLLYPKKKYELDTIISWISQIFCILTDINFRLISFQDYILNLIFSDSINMHYINETMFVNFDCFAMSHNKWSVFQFKYQSSTFKRIFKVIPSVKVPKGCILCSNDTFYVIKHSFNLTPYSAYKNIHFKIEEILNNYKHQPATKLITSVLRCPPKFPSVLFDKALKKFIKSPKLMHSGDVISIDLLVYGIDKIQEFIYFKVVNVEGPTNDHSGLDLEHSFLVSQNTTVFGESFSPCYLPCLEWQLLDYKKLSSLTPILPQGFEKHYFCLLRWMQPFLTSSINGLKPIFIVSGVDGVGKSTLIKAVSKKLGLHYWDLDCNNILSNTLSQINTNVKTILTNAASQSPCILHLKNYQVMSSESDGIDSIQLCESFRNHISEFYPPYPVIILATCLDVESLRREFVRLSLDQLCIDVPTEKERLSMISWLIRVHSIKTNSSTLEFLISETKSFPFASLRNLLCLAEKERIKSRDDLLSISHCTTILGRMSSGTKLSSSVEWADIGGVELIKKEVVSSLISSRLLSSNGNNGVRRTGLLLYGPPGTGKTLLARAVASQSMRAFVPVNGPDLLSMYVGQSEANVRAVFSRAREASPCIMFFDELDSIAPNRGNKSDSGGVMDRVVSTLLSEMDSLDSSGDVFILGATNRPDLLDPALLRPGRFDKMLYIGPCRDEDSKLKVLKALSRKFLMEDVVLDDLVKMLPAEITGATLYAICSTAWLSAARHLIRVGQGTTVVVQKKHFEQALNEITK